MRALICNCLLVQGGSCSARLNIIASLESSFPFIAVSSAPASVATIDVYTYLHSRERIVVVCENLMASHVSCSYMVSKLLFSAQPCPLNSPETFLPVAPSGSCLLRPYLDVLQFQGSSSLKSYSLALNIFGVV
jgi:hypothetical protein